MTDDVLDGYWFQTFFLLLPLEKGHRIGDCGRRGDWAPLQDDDMKVEGGEAGSSRRPSV
jgi:hypothetical protein